MPVTYKLISTVTVSTATQAAMEFTSIPGTFDDLVLKISSRGDQAQIYNEFVISFNGNTSNFSNRILEGNGQTVASYSNQARRVGVTAGANATASTFGNAEIYIPNYAGSTNKSFSVDGVSENNGTSAWSDLVAGLWSNTAAITSITLTPESGSFVTHSTAVLYGIKKS